MLSFLLGKYLGVDWLDHVIGIWLAYENPVKQNFSHVFISFTYPPMVYENSSFLCSHRASVWSIFMNFNNSNALSVYATQVTVHNEGSQWLVGTGTIPDSSLSSGAFLDRWFPCIHAH